MRDFRPSLPITLRLVHDVPRLQQTWARPVEEPAAPAPHVGNYKGLILRLCEDGVSRGELSFIFESGQVVEEWCSGFLTEFPSLVIEPPAARVTTRLISVG